jgi:hypothetical protein
MVIVEGELMIEAWESIMRGVSLPTSASLSATDCAGPALGL